MTAVDHEPLGPRIGAKGRLLAEPPMRVSPACTLMAAVLLANPAFADEPAIVVRTAGRGDIDLVHDLAEIGGGGGHTLGQSLGGGDGLAGAVIGAGSDA